MDWYGHIRKYSGLFLDTWIVSVLLVNCIARGVLATNLNIVFYGLALLCVVWIGSRINQIMFGKHGLRSVHVYVWSFLVASTAAGIGMYHNLDYPLAMIFVWSLFSAGFTVWIFTCVTCERMYIKKTPH